MVLDTTKETICINQIIGQKNDVLTVEGDVIVNDIKPDVLNTVSSKGNVCIYKKEVLDGKLKIDGCVNVYIMYLADDERGSVRCLNTSLDFTHIMDVDACKAGMDLDELISIRNIDCKVVNSRKINVKAYLEIDVTVCSNDNIPIIKEVTDVEGIQTLNNTMELNSLLGSGSSKIYAKDTVVLDNTDSLAEILRTDIDIVNRDTKTSYNKILAKADAHVKIMYLTEDNDIKMANCEIPVMGFIDVMNVAEDNICDTKYKLKNFIVKPNNIEEHSIYVEAEIEINAYVYEKKEVNIIQDLYSPIEDVNFTKKEVIALTGKENIKEVHNIKEELSIPEIKNNKIYDVSVNVNIENADIKNGKISYEGEVALEVLYNAENSSNIDIKSINVPFNVTVNNENIKENSNIETLATAQRQDFIVMENGTVNADLDLEFDTSVSNNEKVNVIDEITIEPKTECSSDSMVIYFVKSGDTLWNIAKRFGSTVEDIARVNEIEDVNYIVPGTQLYIPRYCKRKTA